MSHLVSLWSSPEDPKTPAWFWFAFLGVFASMHGIAHWLAVRP